MRSAGAASLSLIRGMLPLEAARVGQEAGRRRQPQ
jgi:hypothetical protein